MCGLSVCVLYVLLKLFNLFVYVFSTFEFGVDVKCVTDLSVKLPVSVFRSVSLYVVAYC